ncbi:hypothetical protein HY212_06430 [Candidatus Pacearchaeota archaeon]|nr:hypothetical protein [Candidatus Pacearchaeota archaeon]
MGKREDIKRSQINGGINRKYLFLIILVTLLIGGFIYYVNFIADNNKNDLKFEKYITNEKICQNAQISDLCGGLNIAYGSGYRSLCCIERSTCC